MALGAAQGVHLLTAQRIRTGWGFLNETRWPYDGRRWPPALPNGHQDFDRIASHNRSIGFFSVRNVDDARFLLSVGRSFQLTVPITNYWKASTDGVISLPLSVNSNTFTYMHAISICGYDDSTRHFMFRNSWGQRWGDNGYGYLPYSYMTLYMTEAWADSEIGIFRPNLPSDQYVVYTNHFVNDLQNSSARFVIFGPGGVKVGWCFTSVRDGYLDVEDFFVKPSYNPVQHSIALARDLLIERDLTKLSLRFWVSHCDAPSSSYNHVVVSNVIAGLGLKLRASPQRWAASVAI
jgi:hypothetical protein